MIAAVEPALGVVAVAAGAAAEPEPPDAAGAAVDCEVVVMVVIEPDEDDSDGPALLGVLAAPAADGAEADVPAEVGVAAEACDNRTRPYSEPVRESTCVRTACGSRSDNTFTLLSR